MNDYDRLFQKYNLAVAQNQDLHEQLETKMQQWKNREEQMNINETSIRELCSKILATNRSELALGKQKTWDQMPLDEVIKKATVSLDLYMKNRRELLKELLDESEKRRNEIEKLKDDISRMTAMGLSGEDLSNVDDVQKRIEKEREAEKFIEKMPESLKKQRAKIDRATADEEDDFTESEEDLYGDVGMYEKITPGSIPYKENDKRKEKKEVVRDMAVQKAHEEEIKNLRDEIKEQHWLIIDYIGKTGKSVNADIKQEIKELNSSAYNSALMFLNTKRIIRKENIKNPIRKIMTIIEFTELGRMLYFDKHKKTPAESEASVVRRNHNNLNHGYGIKAITNELKNSGEFVEVTDDTRRKYVKKLGSGIEYIPDIVCKDANGKIVYIEYEVGTTSQTDFEGKVNKMMKVTDTLNIATPNRDVAEKYCTCVKKWIINMTPTRLKNITVRIMSAEQMKGNDNIINNDSWKYVFTPGTKGDEPLINN